VVVHETGTLLRGNLFRVQGACDVGGTMTEEALRSHIIMWGVESAAPQFGTSVPVLKGWMRGDSSLPDQVWQSWVRFSSLPPEERPAIVGFEARTSNPSAPAPENPSTMPQSSLAARVLADPGIAARIKAETTRAPVATPITGDVVFERPAPDIAFDEIPEKKPPPQSSNGVSPKVGTIAFCCPTDRDFPPVTMECFGVLMRNYQTPLVIKSETLLIRARNVIVERFLRTNAEWSFWADSDMVLPFGNAQWFKDKSKITNLRPEQYGFDVIKRLLSHRQDFVGAVYAARTENSQLVIQPDLDPRHQADQELANQIRKNQAHGLKDVRWLGFGCVLVHRRVFEAIGRNDAEVRNGKASFFDTQGDKGEDIRFSERAAAAGFRAKLDSELVVGHLGRKCFIPEQTQPIKALAPIQK
jgi:hypothetical protein